jgi:D-proline reductase (dithiol) PrdB
VGLVQRVFEASGLPTVALSMIPDLTRAVGVPRLAGIGYPMGRPLGRPHDSEGQRAVLRATLDLLATAEGPDAYVELPFAWPESPAQARNASRDVRPPPIVELLAKKPWLVVNLYSGRVPHATSAHAGAGWSRNSEGGVSSPPSPKP